MSQTFLAELMDEYGLTQLKLAKGLGIQQGKISLMVNGKRTANSEEAARLEEYFGFPIEQLLETVEDTDGNLVYT